MTYGESIRYLLSLLGDIRGSNFGLKRMERLMVRLGQPQRLFPTIHVAGTNGKGSTAAFIESGLRASGKSTGLYTSPHLARFNERLRLDGAEVSDSGFAAAVGEVRAANEWLVAREGPQAHPTFFESVTAVAFCGFRNARVDWGIVEVGLGGRLDATNVVNPTLAVITPIELDHERFLGKDKSSIAAEKAGILKPGSRVVVAPQSPKAWTVIEERAKQLGVEVILIGCHWHAEGLSEVRGCYRFEARKSPDGFTVGGAGKRTAGNGVESTVESALGKAIDIAVPLAGEHQVWNALTAVASLDALGVPLAAISAGIEQTEWPGRLERLPGPPEILLDAAHNPAGARTLANFLTKHESGRRIHLIYGAARDKAIDEVASTLFPCADRVILTRSAVARSASPQTLLAITDHHHEHISLSRNVDDAIEQARAAASAEDLIVVTGSIFLVGEAREFLLGVAV